MNTGDHGPDQVGSRKLFDADCKSSVPTATEPTAYVWHMRDDCSCHQYQLEVKNEMVMMNGCMAYLGSKHNYFPTLAKTMNLWRAYFRRIFTTWRQQLGWASAKKYTGKTPPRCLSGRWGSASASEDYLPLETEDEYMDTVLIVSFSRCLQHI